MSRRHLALAAGLALALSASFAAPGLAQNLSAQSGRIIELTRAGKYADALPLAERTIASNQAQLRVVLPVLFAAREQQLPGADKALDEALAAIQRGTQSAAASAVNKLAVRMAAGTDRLAELVRRDQDLGSEAEALDKAIVSAVSKPSGQRDAAAEQRSRARLAAIASERTDLQKSHAVEFPDYAALSNPLPPTFISAATPARRR